MASKSALFAAFCIIAVLLSCPVASYSLFRDNFENGLSNWYTLSGQIVQDPLNPTNHALHFNSLGSGGDAYGPLLHSSTGVFIFKFDYLGYPHSSNSGGFVGIADGLPGNHNWYAATEYWTNVGTLLIDDGQWHTYYMLLEHAADSRMILEDFVGVPGDAYFDNIDIILPDQVSLYDNFDLGPTASMWSTYGHAVFSNGYFHFSALQGGGDLFSKPLTNPSGKNMISFWYMGNPNLGGVPDDLGGFIGATTVAGPPAFSAIGDGPSYAWFGGTQASYPGLYQHIIDDGNWRAYSVRFDTNPASTIEVMVEDWNGSGGVAGDANFDFIVVATYSDDTYCCSATFDQCASIAAACSAFVCSSPLIQTECQAVKNVCLQLSSECNALVSHC